MQFPFLAPGFKLAKVVAEHDFGLTHPLQADSVRSNFKADDARRRAACASGVYVRID